MLSGQGFEEVYNLAGGIKAWQGHKVSGPAELGMGLITGEEEPLEMIRIVYGMEEGMRGFYQQLCNRAPDAELSALCRELARTEEQHKQMLSELYRKHGGEGEGSRGLEEDITSDATENGMSSEEILQQLPPETTSREDLVMLAMMLEAQALDLYLRYARRSRRDDTTGVLHELADQEKAHLASLGELMEKSGS